jgi:hypothetical protein
MNSILDVVTISLKPTKWRQFISGATETNKNPRTLEIVARPEVNVARGILSLSNGKKLWDFDIAFGISAGDPITASGKKLDEGIGLLLYFEEEPDSDTAPSIITGWFCLGEQNFDDVWHRLARKPTLDFQFALQISGIKKNGVIGDATWVIKPDNLNSLLIVGATLVFSSAS